MNAIAINDRQQFPKYILGYDTPEGAAAASNLAGGTDFVIAGQSATVPIGGPGSVIRSVVITPVSTTLTASSLTVNGTSFTIFGGAIHTQVPPPVDLKLGIQQATEANCSITTGTGVNATVTGYFTPTI